MKLLPAVPGDFTQQNLHRRAASVSLASFSQLFKVIDGWEQVALVILDVIPGDDSFIIYEIFVAPGRRRAGTGTRVIGEIEKMAVKAGRCWLRLTARPLDETIAKEKLVRWYTKLGFTATTGADGMEKRVGCA